MLYINIINFILLWCTVVALQQTCQLPETKIKHSVEVLKRGKLVRKFYLKKNIVLNTETETLAIITSMSSLCTNFLKINGELYKLQLNNIKLKTIEPEAFSNQKIMDELILSNNQLEKLASKTFNNIPVTLIDLSNNKIAILEKNAFTNLTRLTKLFLNNNQIAVLNPNSINVKGITVFEINFNKLEKLVKNQFSFMSTTSGRLAIAKNKINVIDANAFDGINLYELNMTKNAMTEIPRSLFKDSKLRMIDFRENKLHSLPTEFFQQNYLQMAFFKKNELSCSILEQLQTFSMKNNVIIYYDKINKC